MRCGSERSVPADLRKDSEQREVLGAQHCSMRANIVSDAGTVVFGEARASQLTVKQHHIVVLGILTSVGLAACGGDSASSVSSSASGPAAT